MQEHLVKIIQFEQHLPLRTRFCGEYEQQRATEAQKDADFTALNF